MTGQPQPAHPSDVERAVHWKGYPTGLAPLSRLRWGIEWTDGHGRPAPLGILRWAFELGRHAAFRTTDLLAAALLAVLGLGAARPRPARLARGAGRLAVVLPILPDLSHTFVYREVEALRELDPTVAVFVLEAGTTAVVHPEAARLFACARKVPMRGVFARAMLVFAAALLSPRRLRALAGFYRGVDGGPRAALLGKLPLREARHPGRALELAVALRAVAPSQIHVYGSTWSANAALGAAVLLDVPCSISSYVDFEFDYAFRMLSAKFALARFFRVCTADCARRLSALLDLDDATVRARVPILHWGIDAQRIQARPEAAAPALRRDALRLFSACRVVAKKGLHLMPALLAALAERGIDAHWTLAGDGPELNDVRARAREAGVESRCTFLGPRTNDLILEQLDSTDIAILPCIETADGERDGIPVFLVEALALGRVVVTTPVSGIPELVVDGATGFLASAEIAGLANTIERILADPQRSREVAARGRAAALATEDCRSSASALIALLRSDDAD